MTNRQLSKLPEWKGKICVECGRETSETLLDINRYLEGKDRMRCADTFECAKERNKRKNSKTLKQ